jgi:hypothetical protein
MFLNLAPLILCIFAFKYANACFGGCGFGMPGFGGFGGFGGGFGGLGYPGKYLIL